MKNINEMTLIIIDLIENTKGYTTASKIAELLNVSVRSIIRYINVINTIDDRNSFKIIAVPNKGLKLQILNAKEFIEFKDSILYLDFYLHENFELLVKILFENINSVTELGEILNYSESSLIRISNTINKKLSGRGLSILKNKNEIFVVGNEVRIRNFMMFLMSGIGREKGELSFSVLNQNIYNQVSDFVDQNIESECNDDLKTFVFINLIRIMNNQKLNFNSIMQFIFTETKSHADIVGKIKDFSAKIINIEFSRDEEVFLWLFTLNQNPGAFNFIDFVDSLTPFIEQGLDMVDEKFGTQFEEDMVLKNGLLYHISTSLVKYLVLDKSSNSLIDDIRLNYTNAYCYALELANYLYEKLALEIDEHDIGYLTLHFATSMEKSINEIVYKAEVIYINDLTSAKLLKARIENRFKNISIESVRKCNGTKIEENKIYFTSESELSLEGNVNLVSPFVTHADAEIISKSILEISGYVPFIKLCYNKNFHVIVQPLDKNAVLNYLLDDLIENEYITTEEKENIFLREQLSSTEIALNIAFPHAMISGKSFLSVAILKQPIIWKNNPVKVVLIMGLNKKDKDSKDAIRYIFKNITNIDKVNQLAKTESFNEFIKIIRG